jgi:hypothetical protein
VDCQNYPYHICFGCEEDWFHVSSCSVCNNTYCMSDGFGDHEDPAMACYCRRRIVHDCCYSNTDRCNGGGCPSGFCSGCFNPKCNNTWIFKPLGFTSCQPSTYHPHPLTPLNELASFVEKLNPLNGTEHIRLLHCNAPNERVAATEARRAALENMGLFGC